MKKRVCFLVIMMNGSISLSASQAASSSSVMICNQGLSSKERLKELIEEFEHGYQNAKKETQHSLKVLALNNDVAQATVKVSNYQVNFKNPALINRICEYAELKDLELFGSAKIMQYALAYKACQVAQGCTNLPAKFSKNALFGREIDFNFPTFENRFPLLMAAKCKKDDSDEVYANRARLCSHMLAHGAKVNVVNERGNTPLMMCVGNTLVTHIMLDHMVKTNQLALIDHSNNAGQTALTRAARYVVEHDPVSSLIRKEPSIAVPLALLKAGASPEEMDNKGNSFNCLKSKSLALQAAWALFKQGSDDKMKSEDGQDGNNKKRKNEDKENKEDEPDGPARKKFKFEDEF